MASHFTKMLYSTVVYVENGVVRDDCTVLLRLILIS